jgi:hypothetical protein
MEPDSLPEKESEEKKRREDLRLGGENGERRGKANEEKPKKTTHPPQTHTQAQAPSPASAAIMVTRLTGTAAAAGTAYLASAGAAAGRPGLIFSVKSAPVVIAQAQPVSDGGMVHGAWG